mgnify:CR=1 FL=1
MAIKLQLKKIKGKVSELTLPFYNEKLSSLSLFEYVLSSS